MWYSTCDGQISVADLPAYSNERKDTWQHPVPLHEKLYGDAGNLELTAAFFNLINVNV
jgi:hypothetical protein